MAVVSSSSPATACAVPHIAIFPFMAKGHTIPLIHLVHHLRRHNLATVTFFTTHGNAAFVREGLSSTDACVVALTFPANVPGIPPGVESAEGLTSLASFAAFAGAASLLEPQLEESLATMEPPARLLVADAFLYWTNAPAARLGVPKVSFLGISAFAHVIRELRVRHDPCATLRQHEPGNVDGDVNPPAAELFTVPEFPHVKLSFEDLMAPFGDPASVAPMMELDGKLGTAVAESQGLIINTFHALERPYMEFWNQHVGPRAWPVGPLCLAQKPQPAPASPCDGDADPQDQPAWMQWLDAKAAAGQAVLYVALGTLAAIPDAQLKEVADGLERSEVNFIWAVRPENIDLSQGFEDRTKDRGLVVRDWLDQPGILGHASVRGFLSHCGWNSVLESVAAGVPLAVWPLHADQPLNARLLVEELKVAVRVHTSDGTIRGMVPSQEVSRAVRALMEGEEGAEAARNIAPLSTAAKEAMEGGGPSSKATKDMIDELCAKSLLHGDGGDSSSEVSSSQDEKVDV